MTSNKIKQKKRQEAINKRITRDVDLKIIKAMPADDTNGRNIATIFEFDES